MTNWKEYKLGDLVAINERSIGKGFDFKSIEYIDTSSVTENKFDAPNYTTIAEAPSRAKRLIADGDTIISTVRPIQKHYGFIKNSKPNQVVSTGFAVVTPKKIEPRYLYYFLTQSEITEFLDTIAEGGTTTFPAFKADELKDLPIKLPDYETQTAIAEILSSLDDKIELNNKINQELENLAQTLFKQWFIDFEFPVSLNHDSLDLHDEQDLKINTKEKNQINYKNQGNQANPKNQGSDTYRSSGGEMVESELGEIPKGWKVSTIEEITEVVTKGTTPTTIGGKFTESGINFIKVESLTEQGAFIKSKFGFIDEDTNQLLKRSIIKEGDVLFSIAGTIGRVAVVTKDILPANTNQAIAIIRPNKVNSNFLKLLMQSALIQNDTKSNVVQAVQANLSLGVIKATKFIKPSSEILEVFQSTLKEVFEQVNLLTEETQELTNLRDTLLPKLISGELEVNGLNRDFLDLLDEKDFKKNAKINQGSDNNQGNQDNPKNQG